MKTPENAISDNHLIIYERHNKLRPIKLNLYGFFIIYFMISVINLYLTIYLPLYLLNILGVNRNQLGIIQFITYPLMLIAPLFGFLFDLKQKTKPIILSSLVIFIVSFFTTFAFTTNLYIFSFSLALNILSQEAIKVGISKMIIILAKNEAFKDKNLAAINISSNLGSLVPSTMFVFLISDINNLNQWNSFFNIGLILSLIILFSPFFLQNKNNITSKSESKTVTESSNKMRITTFVLLFISYFLIWSDKLYQFPFSSWVYSKFGMEGFNVFSICYVLFIFLNILGWIIGEKISKKFSMLRIESDDSDIFCSTTLRNKIKMIIISDIIYILLTISIPLTNLISFLIIFGSLYIISGILMLNFISLLMTVSSKGRYKTFSFQCLKSAALLGCVIFVPLGTLLSAVIQIEILYLIVGGLSAFSLFPLLFLWSIGKSKKIKN